MFWLGWLDSNQRNAGVKVLCLTDLATSQCGDALKGVKWGGRRACVPLEKMGWVNGFEPSASRATIWRSNQLSYTHRIIQVARPKGLEPLAHCLEGSCSIRLSYGRTLRKFVGAGDGNRTHMASLEGWSSTTELHLHDTHIRCLINLPHPAEKVKSVFGGQACAGPGIGGAGRPGGTKAFCAADVKASAGHLLNGVFRVIISSEEYALFCRSGLVLSKKALFGKIVRHPV